MKSYIAIAAGLVLAGHAAASTYTFNLAAYSNNSGNTAGINSVATLSATAETFSITLSNNSSQGFITSFYLENGAALAGLGSATILNVPGVSFASGATPPNPGGIGSTAAGAWRGNFFSMDADSPSPTHGINPGESLTVNFAIIPNGGFSLLALVNALNSNQIRMAQHYQGWLNGSSEWLTNGTSNTPGSDEPPLVVVPLPPAAWAGLGLLGAMGATRAAKRRARN